MISQLLIALDREFASGGRVIAKRIADEFKIGLLDESIIKTIAEQKGIDPSNLSDFDEVPKSLFGARTVRGYSSSPQVNVARLQFDYIQRKAEDGESFLVLGRCADMLLANYRKLIKIFIMANANAKVKRVIEFENCTEEAALELIRVNNKKRKDYHNYYCPTKWGDSRYYDLCVNTTKLGIDETSDFLIDYIKRRIS